MQFLISCKPPSLPRPSGISMVPRYPTYKKSISLFVLAALSRLDTNQAFGLRCSNIDVVSPCLVSLHALAKLREVLRKEAGEVFPTKAQLFSTSQVHFVSTTSSSFACVSFTCNFLHPQDPKKGAVAQEQASPKAGAKAEAKAKAGAEARA